MLEEIKALLGFPDDDDRDPQLMTIMRLVQQRLCSLLGTDEVPAALAYIVTEVTVLRFNRIGSEGMSSHNVEGESITYQAADDFAAFANDIEAWKEAHAGDVSRKVRFI